MDFPESRRFSMPVINPYSKCAGCSTLFMFANGTSGGSSGAWPSANRGLFIPIYLAGKFNLQAFYCVNGTTATGNVDIGLFKPDGALVASCGSTAQAGTSTLQIITPSGGARWVQPGRYYMALAASSTSSTFFSRTPAVGILQKMGVVQAASMIPLANLPSFASPASGYLPHFGISQLATF